MKKDIAVFSNFLKEKLEQHAKAWDNGKGEASPYLFILRATSFECLVHELNHCSIKNRGRLRGILSMILKTDPIIRKKYGMWTITDLSGDWLFVRLALDSKVVVCTPDDNLVLDLLTADPSIVFKEPKVFKPKQNQNNKFKKNSKPQQQNTAG